MKGFKAKYRKRHFRKQKVSQSVIHWKTQPIGADESSPKRRHWYGNTRGK